MPQDTLRVIARLTARQGKEKELRTLLAGLIAPTHGEPGCLKYELLENLENPGEFTFVEEWKDESALEAHFETEHLRAALGRLPDLLASDLDLRKYRRAG